VCWTLLWEGMTFPSSEQRRATSPQSQRRAMRGSQPQGRPPARSVTLKFRRLRPHAHDHTLTRTHLCLHRGLTTPPHLAAFMLLSSSPGSHMSLCPHSPSSCPQQRPDCQGGKVQPPGAVSQHSPCLSSLWLLLACQGTLRPQSSLGAIRPLGLGGNETFTVGRVGMTAPSQPAGPGSLLGSIALSSAPG
jgi:hypothetical protein